MMDSSICNVAFAGGSCGITMVRVGEHLKDLCSAQNLPVNIRYVDLWVSDYLLPNTDLVIEMFPYYKNLEIPVLNGRPFLDHQAEGEMYTRVLHKIKEILT